MAVKLRWFVLLALLICGINVAAQDREKPTKIIIDYVVGHNDWGVPGVYAHQEIFEIIPVNNKTYKIAGYTKITNSVTADSNPRKKDTAKINFNRIISIKQIDSLYVKLTTSKDNFNYAFIRPRLKTPSKKQILALATNYRLHYKFEDEDWSDVREKIKKNATFR